MRLTGLERTILEHAALGQVLENVQESAPAIGPVYRRLDAAGLIAAEWFADDGLPLEVVLTAAGLTALRQDALH